MWKYLLCLLLRHKPKREHHWDMVGDPRFDGWFVYRCPKCGEWREF